MTHVRVTNHTRIVRVLKIALPLLAIALLSTVFLVQNEDTFESGLVFSDADLATLGDGLAINNPRFTGSTRGGDAIVVTAERAVPDQSMGEQIALESISSTIRYQSGYQVEIHAAQARVEIREKRLSLDGGVNFRTSEGLVARTDGARADLETGALRSTGEVFARSPRGEVTAGMLSVNPRFDANGNPTDNPEIHFEGGVKFVFQPGATD